MCQCVKNISSNNENGNSEKIQTKISSKKEGDKSKFTNNKECNSINYDNLTQVNVTKLDNPTLNPPQHELLDNQFENNKIITLHDEKTENKPSKSDYVKLEILKSHDDTARMEVLRDINKNPNNKFDLNGKQFDVLKTKSNIENSSGAIKEYLRQMAIQTGSAGFAGLTEICIMQPLDVIKVRYQTQSPDSKERFKGLGDAIRKLHKSEGFGVFYKGILPPILMETPKRALKFLCFEQYKNIFSWGTKPTQLTYMCAGAAAGITDSVVTNPFEVIKVALQTEKSSEIGTYEMTKKIIKEGGLGVNGLQKGLSAIMCRNALLTSAYFGVYNSIIKFTTPMDTRAKEFCRKFAVGFIASAIGTCVNTPFDVVKSKIQGKQPNPPEIKYKSLIQSFKTVYREEKLIGFYRGFVPRILRLGTGGAIMMLIYEEVSRILNDLTKPVKIINE